MKEWDNDIDNLYRRAAEEYPLKTGNGEWHKINNKLRAGNTADGVVRTTRRNRNIFIASILLALFAFGIYELISHQNVPIVATTLPGNQSLEQSVERAERDGENHSKQFQVPESGSETTTTNRSTGIITAQSKTDVSNSTSFENAIPASIPENYNKSVISLNDAVHQTEPVTTEIYLKPKQVEQLCLRQAKPYTFSMLSQIEQKQPALINYDKILLKNSFGKKEEKPIKLNLRLPPFFSRLYFGITGSPEFSKVKNSGFTTPGSSFGIVAGLQLNNQLSLETGVRRNNLFFKTFGHYYDRSKLNLNERAIITTINGYNRATELPFLLRYRSVSLSKNSFSIAGGTNLIISHQENYNYLVGKTDRSKNVSREYNKSPVRLFSNMLVSVGYERYLGLETALRIEPYYKLPLRGVGAGDLPVTSMGVHIGLIKYFK